MVQKGLQPRMSHVANPKIASQGDNVACSRGHCFPREGQSVELSAIWLGQESQGNFRKTLQGGQTVVPDQQCTLTELFVTISRHSLLLNTNSNWFLPQGRFRQLTLTLNNLTQHFLASMFLLKRRQMPWSKDKKNSPIFSTTQHVRLCSSPRRLTKNCSHVAWLPSRNHPMLGGSY